MAKFSLLMFFLLSLNFTLLGQINTKDPALLLGLAYGAQLPGADLADRFGNNFYLSSKLVYKPKASDWEWGIFGGIQFGDQVKEDVLAPLRTAQGQIIGNDRSIAEILLRQRGFYFGVGGARSIFLSQGKKRSGILLQLQVGFLQHKIRIQDDPLRSVPQLTEELKKGYDRLSNGAYSSQFVGYQFLGEKGRINFYAGFENILAFTKNRRSFNYDTQISDTANRLGQAIGFKVGWILPFYLGYGEEIFY